MKNQHSSLVKLCLLFLPFFSFIDKIYSQQHSVLIGSPIRQKPAILKEFIESLERLDASSYSVDYFFIDDNTDLTSKHLLKQFAEKKGSSCHILEVTTSAPTGEYVCNENSHFWNEELFQKVGHFKDQIIQYAKEHNYDYLFLIDSDIVLHPQTVSQLISTKKEIVANIFWTSWSQNSLLLPQVWMLDSNTQYEHACGEKLSPEETEQRFLSFLAKMRTPGTHPVGGLGACTLISKQALRKDLSFKRIKNISFQGEDRHFCIRAVALGLDLFVDTHYPAYHIYRESALPDVEHFKRSCLTQKSPTGSPRITLSMIMRNEANHYLRQMLEEAKHYITDAVIIDDASTDNSVAICQEVLAGIPLKIVHNEESKFSNEIVLRKQQWQETIQTNPDWMVFLDADQMFEPRLRQDLRMLVANTNVDVFSFRLYDLWDQNHYREDSYWQAHQSYRPFLVRYRPDIPYTWERETPQHCGSFPTTVLKFIGMISPYRVKHYGWVKEEDRIAKYERYKKLDPDAKYGIREQYESILDPHPTLIAWQD